jgi:hypothetical protein
MANKINWFDLKWNFISGKDESVKVFLKSKGIFKYPSSFVKDWKRDRSEYRRIVEAAIDERMLNEFGGSVSQIRIRMALFAKKLQEIGIEALEKNEQPMTHLEGLKFYIEAAKMERTARGLDSKNKRQFFDINNFIWETRFGREVRGMNADQMARVYQRLDDLEKERNRKDCYSKASIVSSK